MTETPFGNSAESNDEPRAQACATTDQEQGTGGEPPYDEPASGQLLRLETLRSHRNIVDLQEWLAGQLPWQRSLTRRVGDRIRAA